jgi:hypothetical protein
MTLTRKQVEAMYNEELRVLMATETKQKHRRKLVQRLKEQFLAMPIIVDERSDEWILKESKK